MSNINRKLSWVEVGISLASIHYGLGFLLGSGAAIHTRGSLGIIYAVSSAIGLFTLVFIGPFYWKHKKPIWDLLGDKYGIKVKRITAFLSGIWMLGVIASQILGGSSAMYVMGIPKVVGTLLIASLILIMSVVELKKLAKVFSIMLTLSSITLLVILASLGFDWVIISAKDFWVNIPNITATEVIGIIATTVLITFIGMDFHQFIVEAKSKKDTIFGSMYGGGILLVLAMLILALVFGAENTGLVSSVSTGEEVVPSILYAFGEKYSKFIGILLSLPILLVSIGSGGGVTRIVAKTVGELSNEREKADTKKYNVISVLIALFLAISGKSIIDLTVSFYAIYVGSIFIPFMMHVLSEKFKMQPYLSGTIMTSIFLSMAAASGVLILSFIPNTGLHFDTSSTMMAVGFIIAGIVFCISSFNKAFD